MRDLSRLIGARLALVAAGLALSCSAGCKASRTPSEFAQAARAARVAIDRCDQARQDPEATWSAALADANKSLDRVHLVSRGDTDALQERMLRQYLTAVEKERLDWLTFEDSPRWRQQHARHFEGVIKAHDTVMSLEGR